MRAAGPKMQFKNCRGCFGGPFLKKIYFSLTPDFSVFGAWGAGLTGFHPGHAADRLRDDVAPKRHPGLGPGIGLDDPAGQNRFAAASNSRISFSPRPR